MVTVVAKVIAFAVPLLLLLLTAIAGYSYSKIRYLSLPIPTPLALFTIVLPLITGISTHGAYNLVRRPSSTQQYQLTIPLIVVLGFQLTYETIVATLALTYIIPPSSLPCGLETRWQSLFAEKDARAIKAIQNTFDCCGFNSVKDRAWPWGVQHPSACGEVYGRNKSCLGEWRKAEQINAGLFVLVAVFVFIMKALSIISLLTSPSWSQMRWTHPFKDREAPVVDNRAETRRLIEENGVDEESPERPISSRAALQGPINDGDDSGPRVVPSRLSEHDNEWRNEHRGE